MTIRQLMYCALGLLGTGPLTAGELTVKVLDANSGDPVEGALVIVADSSAAEPVKAEMLQKNRTFQPHVLVVPTDSQVNFPNMDSTQHHVYSFSPAKTFNIELYSGKPSAPVTFDQAGVVEVGCNIHDQMQAFIIATDSGIWGNTDASGSMSLPTSTGNDTPVELRVWHPHQEDTTAMESHTLSSPLDGPHEVKLSLKPRPAPRNNLDSLQQRFKDI